MSREIFPAFFFGKFIRIWQNVFQIAKFLSSKANSIPIFGCFDKCCFCVTIQQRGKNI